MQGDYKYTREHSRKEEYSNMKLENAQTKHGKPRKWKSRLNLSCGKLYANYVRNNVVTVYDFLTEIFTAGIKNTQTHMWRF